MKKICNLFTDEEKAQLSYLGSMLHQEPTEEGEEQQSRDEAATRALKAALQA